MSKAFNIARNLGAYQSAFDSSGDLTAPNITADSISAANNVNVGNINVSSSNHTWTLKGIDAPIGDSQTGTAPDTTNNDSGQLAIYNGATKLWGITEHGYNIKPNIPAYNATLYRYNQPITGDPGDLGVYNYGDIVGFGNTIIKPSNIRFNNGNHYDPTTGYFTCPIDGIYVASFNSNWQGGVNVSVWLRPEIHKNGTPIHWFFNSKGVDWEQIGGCVTISANAGDYLYFYKSSYTGGGGGADADTYTHFSIYLLA